MAHHAEVIRAGDRSGQGFQSRRRPLEKSRGIGLTPMACCLWLAGVGAAPWSPGSGEAQVLQQWTQQAVFGDASAAVAVSDTLMFVAINEDEVLRLYRRYPGSACGAAVDSLNVRPNLGFAVSNPGADLEAAVKLTDGNGARIYWLGSHSNAKNGNLRPNRYRLFATQVSGDGSGSPPFSLSYVGRYDNLRDDLIAWDTNNLHHKGANYYGLAASAAAGVLPTAIDGFNIEGLVMAPNGTTAYIAFRTPFVNDSGPTTTLAQRTHALIVPLLNMPALVAGNPTPGPGAAQFGAPFTLGLGSRGVRSVDCASAGQYLITAGPADNASNPPVAPNNFRLFTWSGNAIGEPIERATDFPSGLSPEGAMVPPGLITDQTVVQFVSDDGGGNGCWRSVAATVGSLAIPVHVPLGPIASGGIRFSRPPAPDPARDAVSFAITIPHDEWVDLSIDDLQGRRLMTLWRGVLSTGEHAFTWNGASRTEARARTGLYWVRVQGGEGTTTKRFTLLR